MRCIPLLSLALGLSLQVSGVAGEQPTASVQAPTPAVAAAPDDRSLRMRETRQHVAQLTEERNQLRAANETLATRQGLLIGYGVAMTLLAAWLMMRALTRPAARDQAASEEPDTDLFAAGGTGTLRKNATITIRNGATQEAEVTDQVQTRRAFARTEGGGQNRRLATTSIIRKQPNPSPNSIIAPELEPARPSAATVAPPPLPPGRTATQRVTVRVEQVSDRLAPVDVSVKPGTAPVHRPPGRAPGA